MHRGIYLSVEAILSLLILAALLAVAAPAEKESMQELYIFQKENDLLKIWARDGLPPAEEMVSDFEFAFPQASGAIEIDGEAIEIGEQGGEDAVSASVYFFDEKMRRREIKVKVFC